MNLDTIDYLLCNFAGGADIEEFDDFSFDFFQKSLTFCAFQRNISEFFLFRKWCIVAMQVLPTADNRFPIPP